MATQLYGNIPFSAATAEIQFNGSTVGQLQNLRWSERNNLRRVNAVGSSVPVAILKGVSEYNISATKAFIDANLMATILRGMTVEEIKKTTGGNDLKVTSKGRVNDGTGLTDATAVLQSLIASNNQQFPAYAKVVNFFFDVVVNSTAADNTSGVAAMSDFSSQQIIKFYECSIETRDCRVDTGNLVVMNDVSMLSLGMQYGTNPIISGAEA